MGETMGQVCDELCRC